MEKIYIALSIPANYTPIIPQEHNAPSWWDILPDVLLPQLLLFCILIFGLLVIRYFKRRKYTKGRESMFFKPTIWKILLAVFLFVTPFIVQSLGVKFFNTELWVHGIPGCWYLQPDVLFHINNCPVYLQWVFLLTQILLSYILANIWYND